MSVVPTGSSPEQARATDPGASAWVSANAGSGKTFVLVRRVIRMLLAGTDPARILCLTFTRAAAAEMSARVFAELAAWTRLDDEKLASAIAAVDGRSPAPERLAGARRLFARALDTPGGLKIQTIHAFCERLLHQFAFEANVAAGFRVMEDIEARRQRDEARRRIWVRAARDPEGRFGSALKTVLSYTSDFIHEASIGEFVERRDTLARWMDQHGGVEGALAALCADLGLADGETPAAVRARFLSEASFGETESRDLIQRLEASGVRDQAAAKRLSPALTAPDGDARAAAYLVFFMTAEGKPRKNIVTKGVCAGWDGLADRLSEEAARLAGLLDRVRLAECFESSAALIRLADGAIDEYERYKRAAGLLDFEDLVVKTVALLQRSDASAWVHYKLDRGLQHILVDEAQDTSPRQWEVVQALAGDFHAGESASDEERTIFAVGDEKQSIYSFQGAVPDWFGSVRADMRARALGARATWHDVPLRLSHRSTPAILSAVDRVFAPAEVHRGVTFEEGAPVHEAVRRGEPGQVTVWPLYRPPDTPAPEDWAQPVDHLGVTSPEVLLARRIADTIADWLASGEPLEATGKPIRPGDILILTRTRGALNDAINRQLKRRRVPVAGVDRLALSEHIAVMDLLAVGQVTQLPRDDLSLAAVLKSPLVGLDDEALFDLAYQRQGSLWRALRSASDTDEHLGAAFAKLTGWMRATERLGPYDFFSAIVSSEGGRRAFLARLGPEVDDVLDEFLTLALNFERANVPTIQGFVAWLTDVDLQVKRDADSERDEVRVMTVHGAKGLEAGVVFLVDNGSQPVHSTHDPRLLDLSDDPAAAAPRAVVWNRGAKALPASVREKLENWRERARQEYRRLLYVGMTRARDRLYVCGVAKKTEPSEHAWHALVTSALGADSREVVAEDGTADLVWRPDAGASVPVSSDERVAPADQPRPAWLDRPAPPPADRVNRISPSAAFDAPEPPSRGQIGMFDVDPRERGEVIHRLLQSLPDRAPDMRAALAVTYLAHVAAHWPQAERERTVTEILAVLERPDFAPVFGPGSRAEVDVAGRAGDALVSGRIDRLAITDERILIVDYKTNRSVPDDSDDIPPAYLTQLAHYRRLLMRIYPGRPVEAALLWTRGPVLMPVPEVVIDRVSLDKGG